MFKLSMTNVPDSQKLGKMILDKYTEGVKKIVCPKIVRMIEAASANTVHPEIIVSDKGIITVAVNNPTEAKKYKKLNLQKLVDDNLPLMLKDLYGNL